MGSTSVACSAGDDAGVGRTELRREDEPLDGTETGWGRPAEPGPRWRALLDRARHGSRVAEDSAEEGRPAEGETPESRRPADGLPARPGSSLERRPWTTEPPLPELPGPES